MANLDQALNKMKENDQKAMSMDDIPSVADSVPVTAPTYTYDPATAIYIDEPEDVPEVQSAGVQTNIQSAEDDDIASLKADIMKNRPESKVQEDEAVDSDVQVDGFKSTSLSEWGVKLKADIEKIGIPEEAADVEYKATLEILKRRRKTLIMEEGFDETEIEEAMIKRYEKEIAGLTAKYTGKGTTITVEVDAKDANKIEFSDAQQAKLDRATRIKLVTIDTADIPVAKVKKLDKKESKLKYMKSLRNATISRHSVPLPLSGDFVTFRGALKQEFYALSNEMKGEDEDIYDPDVITRKANFVFEHFVDGVINHTKNERGVTVLNYIDFLKTFKFYDLDMMVYAVVCASSGPMTTPSLPCRGCDEFFEHEFPINSLLDMEGVPESIKAKYDNITKQFSNIKVMEQINDEATDKTKIKSTFTNNIYTLASPSIERVIDVFRPMDFSDKASVSEKYFYSLASIVHEMYVYDEESSDYIKFEVDEYEQMVEAIKLLPQSELTLLDRFMTDFLYMPRFRLKCKCSKCQTDNVYELPATRISFFVNWEDPVEMIQ